VTHNTTNLYLQRKMLTFYLTNILPAFN